MIKECVSDYNRSLHSVTGFSPSYLLFGIDLNIAPIPLMVNDLEQDRRTAFERTSNHFKLNKLRIDKNRRDKTIEVGDYVYVTKGSKLNRRKLDSVREGPFKVINKLSNLMYEVDGKKKRKCLNVYHKNKLIPVSINDRKHLFGKGEM